MTTLLKPPKDPCRLLQAWLDDAARDSGMVNHNVMMLSTVGADGNPSVRAVLHKDFDVATGRLVFFTNYESRKACDIETHPQVALAMHWDALERQVRIEGRAERVTAEVSDAYFSSRPRTHQLGAWASDQSRPSKGWKTLLVRVLEMENRFADRPVPRPPHWGGYAVTPASIEFWQSGVGRVHQRIVYRRDESAKHGWTSQWLYP